jgi:hypothetical protein
MHAAVGAKTQKVFYWILAIVTGVCGLGIIVFSADHLHKGDGIIGALLLALLFVFLIVNKVREKEKMSVGALWAYSVTCGGRSRVVLALRRSRDDENLEFRVLRDCCVKQSRILIDYDKLRRIPYEEFEKLISNKQLKYVGHLR